MNNLETLIKLKAEQEKIANKLYSFVAEKRYELIVDIAKALKSIKGMNKLIVKGYTPRFNDGDACTHNSEVYFNKLYDFQEIAEYDIYGLEEFLGIPDEFTEEPWEWEEIRNINTYNDEDEDKINELASLLDYIIEETYITDYIVFVDLTTDEPTVNYRSYDCGY